MGDERDAFVARYSLWRTGIFVLGSTGLFVVALAGLEVFGESPFKSPRLSEELERWIMGLVAAFCAWAALAWTRRLLTKRAAIQIDARGIHCAARKRIVQWDAIRDVGVYTVKSLRGGLPGGKVELFCFDVEPTQDSGLSRLEILRGDLNFGYSDFSDSLTTEGTDKSFEELLSAVRIFAPDRLAKRLD